MAKKIFFSGLKGGTGKTTLAVHFCNFLFYYKNKTVALVGFDIQKELSFLGKGAPYPIYEINPKNHEEFEATLKSLSAVDHVVFDLPGGINLFNISLHRYADLIVLPTDTDKLDLFKIKAFGEILLVKEITTIDKLCILPNTRIANETLSKKEDFKALVAFQQIKAIAPLIAYSQAMRRLDFLKIDGDVLYKYRETFNYIVSLKCLTELPEKAEL
jgi:cellulose biosynthesis protein BcsQ